MGGLDGGIEDAILPAATGKDVWQVAQDEFGLVEKDSCIYVMDASAAGGIGKHLGKIEMIHSNSLSLKAICATHTQCANASAAASHDSVCVAKPKRRRTNPCYFLVDATDDVLGKYRRLLEWLRAGPGLTMEDHCKLRDDMKADFKLMRKARAKK